MERIGILVVSKCLSAAAIVDALARSENYAPQFYIVEKQLNPFNAQRASVHRVVPNLDLEEVVKFAGRYRGKISFALTDTEDFITAGGRDALEEETGIPAVCVSRKYAVESSKADQRLLFDRLFDGANPRFRVFDARDYADAAAAVSDFERFAAQLGEPVIKPDAPARGAGVGVWGSDFRTGPEMVAFFRNVHSKGRAVVEERLDGEESSFHAFSDGSHFVVAPQTRDYKRAFDGGAGRLTGGMGSYRAAQNSLPFLRPSEWESVVDAERLAFRRWKGRGSNPGLRGIVVYDALMHTGDGFKVLERNSRGGNTEQINILTTMQDDFIEVCLRMIDGRLRTIKFSKQASVVTCVVPEEYGTGMASPKQNRFVDLSAAYRLQESYGDRLRVYPMDLRLEGSGATLMGSSRSVAIVGVAPSIEEAREVSMLGAEAVRGPVRIRKDIASASDLQKSIDHMAALRLRSRS